jgi:Zn ribbon nucleic-acid-binding protein
MAITKELLQTWLVQHDKLGPQVAKNYRSTLDKFVGNGVDVLECLKDGERMKRMLKEVENDNSRSSYASRLAAYVRVMAIEGIVFEVTFNDASNIPRSLGSVMWYETSKAYWRAVSITKHSLRMMDGNVHVPEYVDAEVQTDDVGVVDLSLRLETVVDTPPEEVGENSPSVIPETPSPPQDLDEYDCPPAPKRIRTIVAQNIMSLLAEAGDIMKQVGRDVNDLDDPVRLDMPLSQRRIRMFK